MRRARTAALGAALVFVTAAASAEPSTRECIDTNTQAQLAVKAGKLRTAKALLRSCAVNACPGAVRDDCAVRLANVETRLPTVVVAAKDGAGHALLHVRISIDGERRSDVVDGTPLEVDPGDHDVTLDPGESDAEPPVTSRLFVREGEVGRRLEVVIGKKAVATAAEVPAPVTATRAIAPDARGGGQRAAGIAVTSVGVVGLVVGGVFGALAANAWSQSMEACSSTCKSRSRAVSEHGRALVDATVSTTAFVAGGVLTAGGLALYLAAPQNRSIALVPRPAGAALVGRF